MSRCRVTNHARRDIDEIWLYVAQGSVRAADGLTEALLAQCQILADFPHAGPERDDLAPGLRSWPFGDYLIFYRAIEGGVQIERILHGARDVEAVFSESPP